MCDAATQSILSTIVSQLIAGNEMFTALDVTREAQRNHGIQYRHNDIKDDVHRIYADGEMIMGGNEVYTRTLIDIPGVSGKVFLYHAPQSDTSAYRSKWAPGGYSGTPSATPNAIQVPPLTVSPSVTAPAAQSTSASVLSDFKADKRHRLWIPREKLRSLGVTPGQRVNVLKDGSSLILSPQNGTTPTDLITDYLVDRHGNVALSKMCFTEAGIENQTYYDVIEINGTVVVKKV